MKLTPINSNISTSKSKNSNSLSQNKTSVDLNFQRNEEKKSRIIVDDDGKEYVKVPKWEHTLGNWVGGFFIGLTVIELIHYFATKKPEPWEDALKELKKMK